MGRARPARLPGVSEEIAQTWLVGIVSRDDSLSGLRVHGGLVAAGPAGGRPHRVQVRLRFGSVDAPGFPDAAESRALLDREQALADALGDDALLAAAVTVPGFRDLVFHAADGTRSHQLLASSGVDDVDVSPDPSWSVYRALFADAVVADGDRRMIEEVTRATGEGSPRRSVTHIFRFGDPARADQAAASLREAGLAVTFAAAPDVADAAPPEFTVTEIETLTQVEMARSRDALNGFATSWDGQYLGWRVAEA